MTRHDIEHLGQVCESVFAQMNARDSKTMGLDDLDSFIDRMLWAIRSSKDNPRFDEQKFRQLAKGEIGDSRHIFDHQVEPPHVKDSGL